MTTFLLLLALVACLFVAIFLLLTIYNRPSSVKRRQLSRLARQHFQNSRGTAHLHLMREAESRLQGELRSCEDQLAKSEREFAVLDREQNDELTKQLETYLVQTRLKDVPGIGRAIHDRILHGVFHGRLTDLYNADEAAGVGEARQQAINDWVHHYRALLPTLLNGDFAGKSAILAHFAARRATAQKQISQTSTRQAEIESQLSVLQREMQRFTSVSERDFRASLLDQKAPSNDLDAFNHGVFAEWEPMPDWFKSIVLEEAA
ncbi:MAG: hypothetical protein U0822_21180 [Anaerolineae bacterium]